MTVKTSKATEIFPTPDSKSEFFQKAFKASDRQDLVDILSDIIKLYSRIRPCYSKLPNALLQIT